MEEDVLEPEKESMYEPKASKKSDGNFKGICENILSQLTNNVLSIPFRYPVDPF